MGVVLGKGSAVLCQMSYLDELGPCLTESGPKADYGPSSPSMARRVDQPFGMSPWLVRSSDSVTYVPMTVTGFHLVHVRTGT
jgi:hypothetical protein